MPSFPVVVTGNEVRMGLLTDPEACESSGRATVPTLPAWCCIRGNAQKMRRRIVVGLEPVYQWLSS